MPNKSITGKPVRVLRLLSRMNVGGPSLHVLHLTTGMKEYGFDTRLAVGRPQAIEGSMIPKDFDNTNPLVIIPGLDRPINPIKDFIAFKGIISQILDFKPHIVHTHTAKAGILGRLAAIMCRVPVIVHTFHGHVFEGYFSPKLSQNIIALERFLARLTDLVITLSPNLRSDLINKLRLSRVRKVRVIPLGLDLEKFLNNPRKTNNWRRSIGIPDNAPLLGMVARLVPVKNHLGLLEAFRRMSNQNPDLYLAIVGGGEFEPQIREFIAKYDLTGKVKMCGIVREIEDVYSDLDLLVLASHNEGTPVVLIEALAAGCPVAATQVGGVREVLEDGKLGTFIRIKTDEMVSDLQTLVRSLPFIQPHDEQIRLKIQQRFSVSGLLKSLADGYWEFLGKRFPNGINR